ncbi:MAG: extracellular solute-binding protein [Chloroflexota bacterium]
MSKYYKSFTLLILLVFVLAACGGPDTSTGFVEGGSDFHTPTEAPTEAPTEPAVPMAAGVELAALDGVEVEFWHVWDRAVGDSLQAIVDGFNASNEYGISVVALDQGSYGDIRDAVNAGINTGDIPDITVGYPSDYRPWESAAGIVVDQNPNISDEMVGMTDDDIADYFETFWVQDVFGDERLGLPAQRSGNMIFYNVSWAQELGFDSAPTTPAEFKEQACASSAANGDGTGGWFIDSGASSLAGWIFAFGGEFETADGYDFTSQAAQDTLGFFASMSAEGCAWKPEARFPNPEFATRLGLFFQSSIAGLPFQKGAFEAAGNTDEWTSLAFPSVDGNPVLTVYGPSLVILESTPEEQLASWIFARYFTEAQNQADWIAVSGYFPTRIGTASLLDDFAAENPQWGAARDAMSNTKFEPRFESYGAVRGAMGDAFSQIFADGFDLATVGDVLAALQATEYEIHAETQ